MSLNSQLVWWAKRLPSSHVPPWPQATRFSLTQFEAHVTRVCTVCTNSDSVTGYTYMCDIHSCHNRQISSTSSCLFNGFIVLAMKYVLELSPNSFSGVEISAACRCWPPIDCLLIVESLGNTTCVLRVIVLHEEILCATESFFNEGHSMFSKICVLDSIHYSMEHKNFSCSSLWYPSPNINLDCMLWGRLENPFFPEILTRIIWLWHTSWTELSSVQIMLSKVSLVWIHILANSCPFTLLAADIMSPNLALIHIHFKAFPMYLLMVDGLISRERFLASCLVAPQKLPHHPLQFFFQIHCYFRGYLGLCSQRCWSCSPRPEDQWNIHFRTVAHDVILPSSSIARMISETFMSSSQKWRIRSLWYTER